MSGTVCFLAQLEGSRTYLILWSASRFARSPAVGEGYPGPVWRAQVWVGSGPDGMRSCWGQI